MTGAEARLRTRIKSYCEDRGAYFFTTHQSGTQEKGMPDLIGVYQGQFVAFEVKLPGREHTLTARQNFVLGRIRIARGRGEMITSVADAIRILDAIDSAQAN